MRPPPADNTPPPGFVALFNGKDLTGWKGLLKPPLDNPARRAKLTPDQQAKAQKEADDDMRAHWKVEDGVMVFDGKGRSLCTAKDYGDFEMYVDWKIPPAATAASTSAAAPRCRSGTIQWARAGCIITRRRKPARSDQAGRQADRPMEHDAHQDDRREGVGVAQRRTGGRQRDAGELLGAAPSRSIRSARSSCKTTATSCGSRTSTSGKSSRSRAKNAAQVPRLNRLHCRTANCQLCSTGTADCD